MPGDAAANAAFRATAAEHRLIVIVHSAYLINLGSPDQLTYTRSISEVWDCVHEVPLLAHTAG